MMKFMVFIAVACHTETNQSFICNRKLSHKLPPLNLLSSCSTTGIAASAMDLYYGAQARV